MTERELRHLSRRDLIELIYQMKKTEEALQKELAMVQLKLKDKEIRIANAGSIAEASLVLNGVFDAAQAAADDYIRAIRTASADMEVQIQKAEMQRVRILEEADREAAARIRAAERLAGEILAKASSLGATLSSKSRITEGTYAPLPSESESDAPEVRVADHTDTEKNNTGTEIPESEPTDRNLPSDAPSDTTHTKERPTVTATPVEDATEPLAEDTAEPAEATEVAPESVTLPTEDISPVPTSTEEQVQSTNEISHE